MSMDTHETDFAEWEAELHEPAPLSRALVYIGLLLLCLAVWVVIVAAVITVLS